jgi:nitroreductase
VPAIEAERIGLVNQVVPDDELDATALAFAHRLATASERTTFRSDDHAEAPSATNDHRTSPGDDRAMTSEPSLGLLEGIMTTRAMRRYTDEPVTDDEIWTCHRAAVQAPSGGNIQPYQFVVVTDPDVKARLGEVYRKAWDRYGTATNAAVADSFPNEAARQAWERNVAASDHLARHLGEAPVLVLVLVLVLMPDIEMTVTDADGVMDVGPTYASVYPAVQNFVLAARAQGLGTVLTTVYRIHEDEVRDICGIPDRYQVVALLPLGHPKGSFGVAPRARPAAAITSWDRYGERCAAPE